MSKFIIPPYQAQGWHIPTEGCNPCVPDEFCQLLLFDQLTPAEAWAAYNQRADADGAVAIDSNPCQFELFSSLVDYDFTSEPISAQFQYLEDPETACSIMGLLAEATPEETEFYQSEFPIIISEATDPGGVVYGAIDSVMAEGCFYRLIITVEATFDEGGELSVAFGGNTVFTQEAPLSASYIVEGVAGNDGTFSITSSAFIGTITIVSFDVQPTFNPTGLRLSDGPLIGSVNILQREFVDNSVLFQYQLVLNPDDFRANPCGSLEIAALCCRNEFIYSRCIKPIEDDCGTILMAWAGNRNMFGFVYAGGWAQRMRILADLRFPSWRDEDEVTYIDSSGRKNLIYSEMRKQFEMSYRAPEYVHDALALAWKHTSVFLSTETDSGAYRLVDGESYSPNWNRAAKEANIILEVEKETQNLKNKYC